MQILNHVIMISVFTFSLTLFAQELELEQPKNRIILIDLADRDRVFNESSFRSIERVIFACEVNEKSFSTSHTAGLEKQKIADHRIFCLELKGQDDLSSTDSKRIFGLFNETSEYYKNRGVSPSVGISFQYQNPFCECPLDL